MNPSTLVWRIIENKQTGMGMEKGGRDGLKGGLKENRERQSYRASRSF